MNKFKSWKYVACLALVLCLCAALLPSVVFAAGETTDKTVYVSATGDNTTADGTVSKPYGDIKTAIEKGVHANATADTKTTIVIKDDVNLQEGFENTNHNSFTNKNGEIIITSHDGTTDYDATLKMYDASCGGQYFHLNNNVTIQNINIGATVNYLDAGGYTLHLGTGITGETVAQYLHAHKDTAGSGAESTTTTANILMESGTVGTIYGGGRALGKVRNANITIAGGTVTNLYAVGGAHTSVEITHSGDTSVTVSGGTVTNLYGIKNLAISDGDINVTVTGGTVSNIFGANKGTVSEDINISVTGVSNAFYLCGATDAQVGNVNISFGLPASNSSVNVIGIEGSATAKHVMITATGSYQANAVYAVRGTASAENVTVDVPVTTNAKMVYAISDTGTVSGESVYVCRTNLNGDDYRVQGFTVLDMTNIATLKLSSNNTAGLWTTVKKVVMKDNGNLTVTSTVPVNSTATVNVEVKPSSGDTVALGKTLITVDSKHTNQFVPGEGYTMASATSGTDATWSIHPAIGIYNITLNEKLDANVTVHNMTSDYTVEFQVGDADPVAAQIKDGGKYYVSLWPYEMADTVTVNLKKGTDVVDTAAVTKEAYGEFLAAQGDEYKAVWDAVLAYCDEAEQYLDGTASTLSFDADSLSDYAVVKDGEVDGLVLKMTLGTACEMILDYPADYTLTTNNAKIEDISVVDWGTAVTYELTKGETTVTVTASPMSYVYGQLKTAETVDGLHDLVWTMYNYYTAAMAL